MFFKFNLDTGCTWTKSVIYPAVSHSKFILSLFLIVSIVVGNSAFCQEKKLHYEIIRNGNVVGNVAVAQKISGNRITMTLNSEVNTRFIFNFKAVAKEESVYENGILIWSTIYRKLNGTVKADKKTKASGNEYTIQKGNKSEKLDNYPIRFNMLCTYMTEPVTINKIYSDNFQIELEIIKIGVHHYKIKFPDGNSNEYFYSNGICSKILINHSLYSATIELKS